MWAGKKNPSAQKKSDPANPLFFCQKPIETGQFLTVFRRRKNREFLNPACGY
jgi:hypothetical protein